jgi:GrpB-like predicted nucleotidyltransferase (UPF0157 family)
MFAIEFDTKITRDVIEIPEKYRQRLRRQSAGKSVRVIVLTQDIPDKLEAKNFIDYLLENPLQAESYEPLKRDDIYDRY